MACWLGIGVNINSQIRMSILAFKGFSSFKHKVVVCVGGRILGKVLLDQK